MAPPGQQAKRTASLLDGKADTKQARAAQAAETAPLPAIGAAPVSVALMLVADLASNLVFPRVFPRASPLAHPGPAAEKAAAAGKENLGPAAAEARLMAPPGKQAAEKARLMAPPGQQAKRTASLLDRKADMKQARAAQAAEMAPLPAIGAAPVSVALMLVAAPASNLVFPRASPLAPHLASTLASPLAYPLAHPGPAAEKAAAAGKEILGPAAAEARLMAPPGQQAKRTASLLDRKAGTKQARAAQAAEMAPLPAIGAAPVSVALMLVAAPASNLVFPRASPRVFPLAPSGPAAEKAAAAGKENLGPAATEEARLMALPGKQVKRTASLLDGKAGTKQARAAQAAETAPLPAIGAAPVSVALMLVAAPAPPLAPPLASTLAPPLAPTLAPPLAPPLAPTLAYPLAPSGPAAEKAAAAGKENLGPAAAEEARLMAPPGKQAKRTASLLDGKADTKRARAAQTAEARMPPAGL